MNSHSGESFTEQSGAAHATDRVQVRFHPGQSKEEGKGSRVGGAVLRVGMDLVCARGQGQSECTVASELL